MLLEIHNAPDVSLVRCSGRLVLGDGTDDLLRAVMSQESRHIQIDLSRVNAIDAGGLGVLVALERWARSSNRTIEVTNASKRVREALDLTGLSSVLRVRPAIRSSGEAL